MREMEMYAHDDLVTTARKDAEYGNTAANTAARRSPTIMGPLLRDAVPIPGKGTARHEGNHNKSTAARGGRSAIY